MKITAKSMYMNYKFNIYYKTYIYLKDQQCKSCLGGNPQIHLLENPIEHGFLSTFLKTPYAINYSLSEGTQSFLTCKYGSVQKSVARLADYASLARCPRSNFGCFSWQMNMTIMTISSQFSLSYALGKLFATRNR